MMTDRPRRYLPYGILASLVLLVYFPLLSGTFLWDDQQFFLENRYLTSVEFASKWLTESMTSGAGIVSNFYRPLQLVTHFADLAIWGKAPFGHRLTNLLLHLGASLSLLALIARMLGGADRSRAIWPAFLAASLYALHPIQVEAVGYISGRGDTLVILFGCIAALALEKRFWLSLIALVLALLSKENAIVLPLLLLGYDGLLRGRKLEWKKHLAVAGVVATYIGLRLTSLNFKNTLDFHGASNPLTENYLYRVYTFLSTLPKALALILWPVDLHHERSWPIFASFSEVKVWGGAILLASAAAVILKTWRKRPLISFGVLWWLGSMAPTSNLIALINALFYDHWFIFPSLGLFLVLGEGFKKAWSFPRGRLASVGIWSVLLVSSLFFTIEQSRAWIGPIPLYERILQFEPGSVKAMNNLAMHYDQEGRREEAEQLYQRAIVASDVYAETHHNLALLYLRSGREEQALAEFRRALAIHPGFFQAYTWMGHLLARQGRVEQAREAYRSALGIFPDPEAQRGLAGLGQ